MKPKILVARRLFADLLEPLRAHFELDVHDSDEPLGPQLAARLARALDRWRVLAEPYRTAAQEAISRVAARPDLSPDVREIVSRALAD